MRQDSDVRTPEGRTLHLHSRGAGGTLVLLEAGLGAGGASWGSVLDALPEEIHALAYDRAGYGDSTPASGARDLGALVTDLLAVVDAVEHERLILVGHSWGGPIVRGAAAQLRERGRPVAGVVLVDPGEELADLYFTRTARAMIGAQGAVMPLLSRLGLLAPLQRSAARSLPAPWRDVAAASVSTSAAAQAVRAESRHVTAGLLGLRLDPPAPVGTAVSVVSGRLPEGLGRRMRDELTDAHRARAEVEGGRFVAAEQSGHVIAATEPELIVGEIARLLEA
jgi:pimeloyl-ACP methyl ester carboxylesterase